jgi:ATP-dependent DNA helicase HFM1/MER3
MVERHGERKPVLIFVSTRKSVISTAEALMKEFKSKEAEGRLCPWRRPSM